MSLLLDALKKAAQDKQKGLQQEQAGFDEINKISEARVNDKEILTTEELSLQSMDEVQDVDKVITSDEASRANNLAKSYANDSINGGIHDAKNTVTQASSLESGKNQQVSDANAFTPSDEALAMLIYKTNRSVKRGRRLLVFTVLTFSLIILASAGLFYYTNLQEEISILERKHRMAMQSMRLNTSDEKMANSAEKSEIIRNLVSETSFNEKVQHTKLYTEQQLSRQKLPNNKNASQTGTALLQKAELKTPDKAPAIKNTSPALSIQKIKKLDPVGEKLETAWLAYKNTRYDEARTLYKSVLSLEENNRDALLGLGAIAVIEKDVVIAKHIYLKLLELDPRDPIALAALTSLHDRQFSVADKNYLLSALNKNPRAHQLNFALGNIYAQQNNWKSAQQYYFNAWQHNNENADYIFNLAVSLDQLGKQQQALEFYEKSLLESQNKQPGSSPPGLSQPGFSRKAVKKRIRELSGM